jgi:hypothetical protein
MIARKKWPEENVLAYFVSDEEKGFISFAGNTKGGRITVPLTSCLTGLELAK